MIVNVRDVRVVFDEGGPYEVTALRRTNLSVESGRPVVILGRNGSGKTTLLRALAGALRPSSGAIEVVSDGHSHRPERGWLQKNSEYIHQRVADGLFADLTLAENVALRLQRQSHGSFDPYWKSRGFRQKESAIQELCSFYKARQNRLLLTLSGGEQQLFTLALANVTERPVLLMDEPTSSLDDANRQAILTLVRSYRGRTDVVLLVVTHDREFADALGFEVVTMEAIVAD